MQKLCIILVLMLSVMMNGCTDKKNAVLSSSVKKKLSILFVVGRTIVIVLMCACTVMQNSFANVVM